LLSSPFSQSVTSTIGYLTIEYGIQDWSNKEWREFDENEEVTPQYVLNLVKSVLENKVDLHAADILYEDLNQVYYQHDHSYKVYNICRAVLNLLRLTIYSLATMELEETKFIKGLFNESIDFSHFTMRACAVIDNQVEQNKNDVILLGRKKFDVQIELEFWEWWLTEAIPQAWELAQQSISA